SLKPEAWSLKHERRLIVFAELLGRSCFSFLRGASHAEEMVMRSKELGLDALALCDRDGLYGSVRAFERSRQEGQRVIVGAELSLVVDSARDRPRDRPNGSSTTGKAASVAPEPPVLALLVENHDGYTNLCRLLTLSHADRPKGESALELDWLSSHAKGLFAI